MVTTGKKIVIFFGTSHDFNQLVYKQFRDKIWEKGIGSAAFNINDIDGRIEHKEVLGTYKKEEVVICCFHGIKCHPVSEILKNKLSLTVVTINSMDLINCGAERILSKFSQ